MRGKTQRRSSNNHVVSHNIVESAFFVMSKVLALVGVVNASPMKTRVALRLSSPENIFKRSASLPNR